MRLRFTGELCVMTTKNDSKFEQELTCRFKIDMPKFDKFSPEHVRKFKNLDFYWVLLSKVENA